jgi:thiol:disulfide interchange protein DsbG
MTKQLKVILTVMFTFISSYSIANEEIKVPKMLVSLETEGGIIHEKFKISDHLNGFAITVGTDQLIVYGTADGKHVLNGSLLDDDAKDLTPGFAGEFIPEPDYTDMIAKLEASAYFSSHDINAKRQLYAFHDTNCGYCKKAWAAIMPYKHLKGTEVRWIPVGTRGKDSMIKASALLKSKEPVKLQDDFDKNYRLSQKEISDSSDKGQDAIDNTRLFKFLRFEGTPSFVVVESGKFVELIRGFRRGKILDALGV